MSLTKLSLAGIIPYGDRKLANLFYSVFFQSFELLPLNKVPKLLSTTSSTYRQRWALTLANRSNARQRSNIRAPPRPPPHRCMYPKCENLCGQRVRKRFIAIAGVSGCHIFVPAPHAPPPKGIGQRSKVVILPTTSFYRQ
jgi:hypothetical protein